MRGHIHLKSAFAGMWLLAIFILVSLPGSAFSQGFRPLLSPGENRYWDFAERQWATLDAIQYDINRPMSATTMEQRNREATDRLSDASDHLIRVSKTLKGSGAPPLFQDYHRSLTGLVDAMFGMTSCNAVFLMRTDEQLYEAYQQARGDRQLFHQIASRSVSQTTREIEPLIRKNVDEMAFYRSQMMEDLRRVDDRLNQRHSYPAGQSHAASRPWSITFEPFFLPFRIRLSDKGLDVSFSKKITTPLGPVTIQAGP